MSEFDQKNSLSAARSLDLLVIQSLKCTTQSAQSMGLLNATVLLVSDSQNIKNRFRQHGRVWTPGTKSGHIEKSMRFLSRTDLYFGALVDIFLLALCDALIKSESGFSNLAQGLGMYSIDRVRTFASCGLNTRSGGL